MSVVDNPAPVTHGIESLIIDEDGWFRLQCECGWLTLTEFPQDQVNAVMWELAMDELREHVMEQWRE